MSIAGREASFSDRNFVGALANSDLLLAWRQKTRGLHMSHFLQAVLRSQLIQGAAGIPHIPNLG
jgi:hypothetical protein